MEDLVGKRLKHIQEPGSAGKKVVKVENDTVYFEDNGRAPLNVIQNMFEEVSGGMTTPQQNNGITYPPVTNQPVQATNEAVIDPSNFFTNNSPTLMGLADQIKNFNPNQPNNFVSQAERPVETIGGEVEFNENDPNIMGNLDPDTVMNIKRNMTQNKNKLEAKPQHDAWLTSQFDSEGNAVRKVDIEQMKQDLENAKNGISVKQQEYVNENTVQNNSTPNNTNSSGSTLPKMKKSTKVKINLVLDEMIPKPEAIKNMNDIFETSIIEMLAKEITQELLQNPKNIEAMIVDELERIVYKKKPVKKTVKKVVKKPAKK